MHILQIVRNTAFWYWATQSGSPVYVFRCFGWTVHVVACIWRQQALFEMWADFYQTSPGMHPDFLVVGVGGGGLLTLSGQQQSSCKTSQVFLFLFLQIAVCLSSLNFSGWFHMRSRSHETFGIIIIIIMPTDFFFFANSFWLKGGGLHPTSPPLVEGGWSASHQPPLVATWTSQHHMQEDTKPLTAHCVG